jgi:peroxiredoxin Q/BCP
MAIRTPAIALAVTCLLSLRTFSADPGTTTAEIRTALDSLDAIVSSGDCHRYLQEAASPRIQITIPAERRETATAAFCADWADQQRALRTALNAARRSTPRVEGASAFFNLSNFAVPESFEILGLEKVADRWYIGFTRRIASPDDYYLQPARNFSRDDQHGDTLSLAKMRGKWVVLYVYVQLGTPGDATEAVGFRDELVAFQRRNSRVIGLGANTVRDNATYAKKYSLPFSLVADPNQEIISHFGIQPIAADIERPMRTTFIVDPEGVVRRIYYSVDPRDHAAAVLRDLSALQSGVLLAQRREAPTSKPATGVKLEPVVEKGPSTIQTLAEAALDGYVAYKSQQLSDSSAATSAADANVAPNEQDRLTEIRNANGCTSAASLCRQNPNMCPDARKLMVDAGVNCPEFDAIAMQATSEAQARQQETARIANEKQQSDQRRSAQFTIEQANLKAERDLRAAQVASANQAAARSRTQDQQMSGARPVTQSGTFAWSHFDRYERTHGADRMNYSVFVQNTGTALIRCGGNVQGQAAGTGVPRVSPYNIPVPAGEAREIAVLQNIVNGTGTYNLECRVSN